LPSETARSAFDATPRIAAKTREIHAREEAVEELRRQSTDPRTIEELDSELGKLRQEWLRLAAEYSVAGRQCTKEAAEARHDGEKKK
jgi:hypothetical protein